MVEDSINCNHGLSDEELKKPSLEGRDSGDSVEIPSDYLREVEIKEAKEIKKSPLGVAVHFRFVGLGERRASQKEFETRLGIKRGNQLRCAGSSRNNLLKNANDADCSLSWSHGRISDADVEFKPLVLLPILI